MHRCSTIAFGVLWGTLLSGCASSGSEPTSPQSAAPAGQVTAPSQEQPTLEDNAESRRLETRKEQGPHPLADDREADPERSLPELTYKHLGMHIGGESNSPASKRPWFDDIERHDAALLGCYRLVEQPERGGSYGVDLYVSKRGGAPEVRGSRQKIGGEDFDACMRQAFAQIDFHQPERPTVFSYSILFKLGAE